MRRFRNYDHEGGGPADPGAASSGAAAIFAAGTGTSGSSSSTPGEPPCRTCTDFRTWMKAQKNQSSATGTANSDDLDSNEEAKRVHAAVDKMSDEKVFRLDRDLRSCPADRDDLGAASWKLLHTLSASLPDRPSAEQRRDVEQFVGLFARLYPCRPCGEDFEQDIKENPVRTTSATEFAQWLCGAHNRVNKKLGKEEFDCSKVFERWRDGWKDGSCDY